MVRTIYQAGVAPGQDINLAKPVRSSSMWTERVLFRRASQWTKPTFQGPGGLMSGCCRG